MLDVSSGIGGDGELVDEVVEAVAAVALDPAERHLAGPTSSTSGRHRSALATGCFLALRQPLASHFTHQRSRKQLTTYVESDTTTTGPVGGERPHAPRGRP